MLILTRKPQQSIVVFDTNNRISPIVFNILRIRGNQIYVGIDADESLNIVRTEILQKEELLLLADRLKC